MRTTGCEILFYMVLYLTRSQYISQEKWVGYEFACFVKLSIVFFECYFKPFLCFFTFSGVLTHEPSKGLCQEPIGGLTVRPPAAFCASLFYAHIIWALLVLPMSTFFPVLNPDYIQLFIWTKYLHFYYINVYTNKIKLIKELFTKTCHF